MNIELSEVCLLSSLPVFSFHANEMAYSKLIPNVFIDVNLLSILDLYHSLKLV